MEPNYAEKLLTSMNNLWKSQLHCDVTIKSEHSRQPFYVHSVVLSAASPYMSQLLQHADQFCEKRPTFFLTCHPDSICSLLTYIYTGKLELTCHIVTELYSLGTQWKLDYVVNKCEEFKLQNPNVVLDSDSPLLESASPVPQTTSSDCLTGQQMQDYRAEPSENVERTSETPSQLGYIECGDICDTDNLKLKSICNTREPFEKVHSKGGSEGSLTNTCNDGSLDETRTQLSAFDSNMLPVDQDLSMLSTTMTPDFRSLDTYIKDFYKLPDTKYLLNDANSETLKNTEEVPNINSLTREVSDRHRFALKNQLKYRKYTKYITAAAAKKAALAAKKAADPYYHRGPRQQLPDGITAVTVEKPYGCRLCPETFPSVTECENHLKIAHQIPQEKLEFFLKKPCYTPKHKMPIRYKCMFNDCDYKSVKIPHVVHHRSTVHNIPVPDMFKSLIIPCDKCSLVSRNPAEYRDHIRKHGDQKDFLCQECGIAFKRERKYRDHVKTYHLPPKFPCPYCDYKARKKTTLYNHIRTHTKERPFLCMYCPYTCSTQGYLGIHMQKKHNHKQ